MVQEKKNKIVYSGDFERAYSPKSLKISHEGYRIIERIDDAELAYTEMIGLRSSGDIGNMKEYIKT